MAGFYNFWQVILRLLERCRAHRVGRHSAEVTYYLLFTLFPFVVFLYSAVSVFDVQVLEVLDRLLPVLPEDVYELISEYLSHVGKQNSRFVLYVGSVIAVYMLYRAVSSLNYAVRRATDSPHAAGRRRLLLSLGISLVVMISVFVLLIMFGISRDIYRYLALFFELGAGFGIAANVIRYAAGPIFLFFALGVYYYLLDECNRPYKHYLLGALFAVSVWYAFSAGFMVYTNNYGSYSSVYGSLAAIMALMVWLHTTSMSFIMGAELNSILRQNKING